MFFAYSCVILRATVCTETPLHKRRTGVWDKYSQAFTFQVTYGVINFAFAFITLCNRMRFRM